MTNNCNKMSSYGDSDGFRISVCLKRYFSDERARCYMMAQGSRRVSWLQARLRFTFALEGPLSLVSRGHLLPPDEPLCLLRPDDLVVVIPLKNEQHQQSISDSSEHLSKSLTDVFNNKNKRKRKCEQNMMEKVETAYSSSPPHSPVCVLPLLDYTKKSLDVPDISVSSDCIKSTDKVIIEDKTLQDMKRQALTLLGNYCGAIDGTESPHRRRRVRRRTRRRRVRSQDIDPELAPPVPIDSEPIKEQEKIHLPSCSEHMIPPAPFTSVLLNSFAEPRTARIIRTIATTSACFSSSSAI